MSRNHASTRHTAPSGTTSILRWRRSPGTGIVGFGQPSARSGTWGTPRGVRRGGTRPLVPRSSSCRPIANRSTGRPDGNHAGSSSRSVSDVPVPGPRRRSIASTYPAAISAPGRSSSSRPSGHPSPSECAARGPGSPVGAAGRGARRRRPRSDRCRARQEPTTRLDVDRRCVRELGDAARVGDLVARCAAHAHVDEVDPVVVEVHHAPNRRRRRVWEIGPRVDRTDHDAKLLSGPARLAPFGERRRALSRVVTRERRSRFGTYRGPLLVVVVPCRFPDELFRDPNAIGAFRGDASRQRHRSIEHAPFGTTSLTRPSSSARLRGDRVAGEGHLERDRAVARGAAVRVEQPAPTTPRLTSGTPNVTWSATTARSDAITSSKPPPIAAPFTAAMTGFG